MCNTWEPSLFLILLVAASFCRPYRGFLPLSAPVAQEAEGRLSPLVQRWTLGPILPPPILFRISYGEIVER